MLGCITKLQNLKSYSCLAVWTLSEASPIPVLQEQLVSQWFIPVSSTLELWLQITQDQAVGLVTERGVPSEPNSCSIQDDKSSGEDTGGLHYFTYLKADNDALFFQQHMQCILFIPSPVFHLWVSATAYPEKTFRSDSIPKQFSPIAALALSQQSDCFGVLVFWNCLQIGTFI